MVRPGCEDLALCVYRNEDVSARYSNNRARLQFNISIALLETLILRRWDVGRSQETSY